MFIVLCTGPIVFAPLRGSFRLLRKDDPRIHTNSHEVLTAMSGDRMLLSILRCNSHNHIRRVSHPVPLVRAGRGLLLCKDNDGNQFRFCESPSVSSVHRSQLMSQNIAAHLPALARSSLLIKTVMHSTKHSRVVDILSDVFPTRVTEHHIRQ